MSEEYSPDSDVERYLRREEKRRESSTFSARKSHILRFNEWADEQGHDILEMTPHEVEDFFFYLDDEGYSDGTVEAYFESLRSLYSEFADKRNELDENPVEQLDRGDYSNGRTLKEDEDDIIYVSKEEMEKMAENAPSPKMRNELLVRLMFHTGVRRSEAAEIKVSDIDRDDRAIRVENRKHQNSDKKDSHRKVYYQPSLDSLMRLWLDGGRRESYPTADESNYLFVSNHAAHLSSEVINRIVKEAAENAGIQSVMYVDQRGHERKRITAHALRHGHAVHAIFRAGIDLRSVQMHMGHASIDQTEQYLQLADDDVREAYERFDTA